MYNDNRFYCLEITTTNLCNMRCDYCFEPQSVDTNNLNKRVPDLIEKLDEILESKWRKNNFNGGLNIGFWGGEPTLNLYLIEELLSYYKDNKNVIFHIYTNGYKIEKLISILEPLAKNLMSDNDLPKMKVQISYDGNPVHDMSRKNVKGEPTSKEVLQNARSLYDIGFEVRFKSTLKPAYFKYMPEIWDDLEKLYYKFGRAKSFAYTPTIDVKNVYKDNCFEEFKKSVIKIAKKEVNFYKKEKRFLWNWVNGSKVFCKPGVTLTSLDTNGDLYYCHRCFYLPDEKETTKVGSIFDSDIVKKLENTHSFLLNKSEPDIEECDDCEATMCIRCNVQKFEQSNKNNFLDKWFDYLSQPDQCNYFKFFGKVNRAIRKIIFEEA